MKNPVKHLAILAAFAGFSTTMTSCGSGEKSRLQKENDSLKMIVANAVIFRTEKQLDSLSKACLFDFNLIRHQLDSVHHAVVEQEFGMGRYKDAFARAQAQEKEFLDYSLRKDLLKKYPDLSFEITSNRRLNVEANHDNIQTILHSKLTFEK